jgi:hypothetical protein
VVDSRTVTAAAGLAASLLVSALLWWQFDTLAVFLFVPFVPFLLRGWSPDRPEGTVAECPVCGFRTAEDSFAYCPRDGTRLE